MVFLCVVKMLNDDQIAELRRRGVIIAYRERGHVHTPASRATGPHMSSVRKTGDPFGADDTPISPFDIETQFQPAFQGSIGNIPTSIDGVELVPDDFSELHLTSGESFRVIGGLWTGPLNYEEFRHSLAIDEGVTIDMVNGTKITFVDGNWTIAGDDGVPLRRYSVHGWETIPQRIDSAHIVDSLSYDPSGHGAMAEAFAASYGQQEGAAAAVPSDAGIAAAAMAAFAADVGGGVDAPAEEVSHPPPPQITTRPGKRARTDGGITALVDDISAAEDDIIEIVEQQEQVMADILEASGTDTDHSKLINMAVVYGDRGRLKINRINDLELELSQRIMGVLEEDEEEWNDTRYIARFMNSVAIGAHFAQKGKRSAIADPFELADQCQAIFSMKIISMVSSMAKKISWDSVDDVRLKGKGAEWTHPPDPYIRWRGLMESYLENSNTFQVGLIPDAEGSDALGPPSIGPSKYNSAEKKGRQSTRIPEGEVDRSISQPSIEAEAYATGRASYWAEHPIREEHAGAARHIGIEWSEAASIFKAMRENPGDGLWMDPLVLGSLPGDMLSVVLGSETGGAWQDAGPNEMSQSGLSKSHGVRRLAGFEYAKYIGMGATNLFMTGEGLGNAKITRDIVYLSAARVVYDAYGSVPQKHVDHGVQLDKSGIIDTSGKTNQVRELFGSTFVSEVGSHFPTNGIPRTMYGQSVFIGFLKVYYEPRKHSQKGTGISDIYGQVLGRLPSSQQNEYSEKRYYFRPVFYVRWTSERDLYMFDPKRGSRDASINAVSRSGIVPEELWPDSMNTHRGLMINNIKRGIDHSMVIERMQSLKSVGTESPPEFIPDTSAQLHSSVEDWQLMVSRYDIVPGFSKYPTSSGAGALLIHHLDTGATIPSLAGGGSPYGTPNFFQGRDPAATIPGTTERKSSKELVSSFRLITFVDDFMGEGATLVASKQSRSGTQSRLKKINAAIDRLSALFPVFGGIPSAEDIRDSIYRTGSPGEKDTSILHLMTYAKERINLAGLEVYRYLIARELCAQLWGNMSAGVSTADITSVWPETVMHKFRMPIVDPGFTPHMHEFATSGKGFAVSTVEFETTLGYLARGFVTGFASGPRSGYSGYIAHSADFLDGVGHESPIDDIMERLDAQSVVFRVRMPTASTIQQTPESILATIKYSVMMIADRGIVPVTLNTHNYYELSGGRQHVTPFSILLSAVIEGTMDKDALLPSVRSPRVDAGVLMLLGSNTHEGTTFVDMPMNVIDGSWTPYVFKLSSTGTRPLMYDSDTKAHISSVHGGTSVAAATLISRTADYLQVIGEPPSDGLDGRIAEARRAADAAKDEHDTFFRSDDDDDSSDSSSDSGDSSSDSEPLESAQGQSGPTRDPYAPPDEPLDVGDDLTGLSGVDDI